MVKQKILSLILVFVFMINPLQAKAFNGPDFADLAENLLPTVVNIATTQKMVMGGEHQEQEMPELNLPEGSPFEDFFKDFMERQGAMPSQPVSSLGSGFVINGKLGYVVTNNHVVQDADEIKVILQDETTLDAILVGRDEKTDLAVLKIEPRDGLKGTNWGDSDKMRVGNWVMAIGNPFGLGGTVTSGIISARHRDINAGPYDNFIQSDASINRGNSGGPLFNLNGEVIGINTAIFSPSGGSVGIGFAIPSNLAKSVINQLIKYGETKRGWLGVKIQTVTDEIASSLGLAKAQGALVANSIKGGPSANAGIKAGDIIIGFDGKEIKEMRELPRIVAEADIGKVVDVRVWRDKKEITLKVNLGQLEKAEKEGVIETGKEVIKKEKVITSVEMSELGISIGKITESIRQQYGIDENTSGIVITKVNPSSSAAKKGIRPGDVVVEFDQEEILHAKQMVEILGEVKKDKRDLVLIYLNRNGNMRFVGLTLNNKD